MSEEQEEGLLNTGDLQNASSFLVTGGRGGDVKECDFEKIFQAHAVAMGLINQNETLKDLMGSESVSSAALAVFDADGDGKITQKDFVILFDRYQSFLDAKKDVIDNYLPVVGQCGFGILTGGCVGFVARVLGRYKFPFLFLGIAGYSAIQYAAQQQFINREIMLKTLQSKTSELADHNNDGRIDAKDLESLIEARMKVVNQKLGPGGFAPGALGYATFLFGLWRSVRKGRRFKK